MTVKLYTIPTCFACSLYESTMRQCCLDLQYSLETYDIDADPVLSVQYLQEYRACADAIPFFAIYDDEMDRINCFSGILDRTELYRILLKNVR